MSNDEETPAMARARAALARLEATLAIPRATGEPWVIPPEVQAAMAARAEASEQPASSPVDPAPAEPSDKHPVSFGLLRAFAATTGKVMKEEFEQRMTRIIILEQRLAELEARLVQAEARL